MASGSLADLTASVRQRDGAVIKVRRAPADAALEIAKIPGVDKVQRQDGEIRIEWSPGQDPRDAVARLCLDRQYGLLELRPASLGLEDIYLRIVSGGGAQ
jgi:ABC-2 type transport system ATP-binding protein